MHKRYVLLLVFPLLLSMLVAQNTLSLNGLNEAQFIYRTAPDSLNAYFQDSFSFNLAYRNFGFGMKYIAELPKYSNQQAELVDQLSPTQLSLGWKELYASYSKDAFNIHAGTTEESFGNGLSFRSYIDPEFDDDNRIDGFSLKYDADIILKALYGAIESPVNVGKYDLAYGADLLSMPVYGLRLGGSALTFRTLDAGSYSQRDVFSGRAQLNSANLDAYAEYAESEAYKQSGLPVIFGSAIYANADYNFCIFQFGAAYKKYKDFNYRLHDPALANYHNETLSDVLATAQDEEGWQARGNISLSECLSLSGDYAEAWDSSKDRQMNDLYAAMDWAKGSSMLGVSYSHVEKADDAGSYWQKETYPTVSAGLSILGKPIYIKGEFKTAEKQIYDHNSKHYEPKIQTDLSLGKLALSIGAQSYWADFDAIMDSRYWAAVEAKYPLASHSDIVLFAGKEAGGKVCRNGVCRFVSPFQGLKVELSTRF